ncbi:MAG: hypothetical protein J7K94_02845 [Dehalococcoidia bacterium]|nr:hypothetical protein [Dehalococcoidia bacterium]
MEKERFDNLVRAHLEAVEPECRWCFAIDMERVKGEIIAQYDFPDTMLLHLSCPRCGGEWSEYIGGFDGDYLQERICELHPELKGVDGGQQFKQIIPRLWPEHPDGPPKLYRALMVSKEQDSED